MQVHDLTVAVDGPSAERGWTRLDRVGAARNRRYEMLIGPRSVSGRGHLRRRWRRVLRYWFRSAHLLKDSRFYGARRVWASEHTGLWPSSADGHSVYR